MASNVSQAYREVARQLDLAITAIQRGKDEEAGVLIRHFNESESKASNVLDFVMKYWRNRSGDYDDIMPGSSVSTSSSQTSLKKISLDPAGSLRVLLHVETIWKKAAVECINCIHQGFISGKDAIYCISEIRIIMTLLPTIVKSERSASRNAGRYNQDVSYKMIRNFHRKTTVEEFFDFLHEIGEDCISPLFDFALNKKGAARKNLSSSSSSLQTITLCLDLIPVIVSTIATLKNLYEEECSEGNINLVESLFYIEWDAKLVLPLCNIFCELYAHLTPHQLLELQKRLLSSIQSLQTIESEDFAGVIQVSIRLFELSKDYCWINVCIEFHICAGTIR